MRVKPSRQIAAMTVLSALMLSAAAAVPVSLIAQGAQGAQAAPATPAAATAMRLEVQPGTKASYRVREQLAGVNFPNDAVGTTDKIEGRIVIAANGTIDAAQSKLTVDLRGLTSDQARRDGYIQRATLQTEQFPTAVFVPRRAVGLKYPLPIGPDGRAQTTGFQLVGDMTVHGVTKEVTWNVVVAGSADKLTGNATTSFNFAYFNLTKPTVAILLSVEDDIKLELELQMSKVPLS